MPYHLLYYHVVWSTLDRQPLILPEFETRLYNAIAAKARKLKGNVYAVGGVADHVHMVVEIPASIAVQTFVAQVKGNKLTFCQSFT